LEEDRVFIIADPMTNMMLIASSQSTYDEIVRLVSQIDVPPPVDGVILFDYGSCWRKPTALGLLEGGQAREGPPCE